MVYHIICCVVNLCFSLKDKLAIKIDQGIVIKIKLVVMVDYCLRKRCSNLLPG